MMLRSLAAGLVMMSSAHAQEVKTQEPFRPEPELFNKIESYQMINSWDIKETNTDAVSIRKELEQSGFEIAPRRRG